MKSYEEIAKIVFKRRDEYIAKQKKKKRIIISTSVSALCCVLLLSLGLLTNHFLGGGVPVADNGSKNTSSDNGSSVKPPEEEEFYIDSIDKINFYSAKKIIGEKNLLSVKMSRGAFSRPKILLLNKTYAEYTIDRNKDFTATMVTYFTIELNDENGFLAQKLGGTGLVEVVVTENNIEDMGQMITFKRGKKYYTCLMNGQNNEIGSNKISRIFSSHKYINGFSIVKNFEQENYKFTVRYDGAKVIGFECDSYDNLSISYVADDITFIDNFCIVLYSKQTFTINELEEYCKSEQEEETSSERQPSVHTHEYNQKILEDAFLKSAATCKGAAEYYYSCDCGQKGTKTFLSGSPLKHTYSKTVKSPTCSEEGYTEYKCTCGESYKDNFTSATHKHNFVETQKNTSGIWYYTFACKSCGMVADSFGNADGSWGGSNENVKYYVSYTPVSQNGYIEFTDCHIVIYGSGAMPDFTANENSPWNDYLNNTKKITIANGVTTIGAYAFNCPNGSAKITVDMAPSVKTIKTHALDINAKSVIFGSGVERIEGPLNTSKWSSVYLPRSLKHMQWFGSEWRAETTIYYEGSKSEFLSITTISRNTTETFKEVIQSCAEAGYTYCHTYLNASGIGDMDEYMQIHNNY